MLIVVYVTTQLISTMITSVTADKTQRRIILALPFLFVAFVINFEAGLLVYWITTNIWTIGQQLAVRKLLPEAAADRGSDDAKPARSAGAAGKPAAAADGKQAARSRSRPAQGRQGQGAEGRGRRHGRRQGQRQRGQAAAAVAAQEEEAIGQEALDGRATCAHEAEGDTARRGEAER